MDKPNLCDARKRQKQVVNIQRGFSIPDELKIGNNKRYIVKTYGCQMNERDSEEISAILESMGYTESDSIENADVVILNTCAIRENAHNKVFGLLGRLKHMKETKDILVGLCGCMAQEEVVVDEIVKKHKEVNFVFGTHNIHRLPIILNKALTNKQEIEVFSVEGDIIEDVPVKRVYKHKAWVNIMYGCDKFCTYCIVPYTRGKQRSRLKEDILKEVNDLVKSGYKEVTLLGQNVNAYGKDIDGYNYNMANLLNDVSKTGIERIKFVTSHPWDFTDEMIDVIKNNDNILPYIHLPLQSGSDRILKLMGRRYDTKMYLELVDKLRCIPNLCITTDIIVGFPGETEEDFNSTLDIVNKVKYDGAYTFIYSPRIGTSASTMFDDVTLEEKEKRLYKLNDLVNKYSKESNDKLIGKTVSVLIDGESEKEGMLSGYTTTNKLVNVKGDTKLIGKIVDVVITDAKTWSLDGEIKQ